MGQEGNGREPEGGRGVVGLRGPDGRVGREF